MALRFLACRVLGYHMDNTQKQRKQVEDYPNGEVKGLKGLFQNQSSAKSLNDSGFQMPLHYPRYNKAEYESMEGWKVDLLLKQYGLTCNGTLDDKRAYAMGTFLWPNQY